MSTPVPGVLVGLLFVAVVGLLLGKDIRLVAKGESARGEVSIWNPDRGRDTSFNWIVPVVRFQTADGKDVEARTKIRTGAPVAIVAAIAQVRVRVIYDPRNPQNAEIAFLMWPVMASEVLFILLCLVMVAAGVAHLAH